MTPTITAWTSGTYQVAGVHPDVEDAQKAEMRKQGKLPVPLSPGAQFLSPDEIENRTPIEYDGKNWVVIEVLNGQYNVLPA